MTWRETSATAARQLLTEATTLSVADYDELTLTMKDGAKVQLRWPSDAAPEVCEWAR